MKFLKNNIRGHLQVLRTGKGFSHRTYKPLKEPLWRKLCVKLSYTKIKKLHLSNYTIERMRKTSHRVEKDIYKEKSSEKVICN